MLAFRCSIFPLRRPGCLNLSRSKNRKTGGQVKSFFLAKTALWKLHNCCVFHSLLCLALKMLFQSCQTATKSFLLQNSLMGVGTSPSPTDMIRCTQRADDIRPYGGIGTAMGWTPAPASRTKSFLFEEFHSGPGSQKSPANAQQCEFAGHFSCKYRGLSRALPAALYQPA